MENGLITINLTPAKLFSDNGLDPILQEIKKKVDAFEPDVESNKGRKEIASFAMKIAKSKVYIEKMGKELVADMKAKTKLIDAERKRSRDFLDSEKVRARKPLTDYEDAEKIRVEAERQEEIAKIEEEERLKREELEAREKAIAEKEAEMARLEAEKQAEIDKLVAIQKAKDDAKAEAARKERDRLRIETEKAAKKQAAKDIADKKAKNKKHQATINNKIMDALNAIDISPPDAKKIIIAVVQGKIPNLTINY